MYKYFGIALLGIFATMLIPISAESSTGPTFYGIAHVTTFDSTGNPTSTQTVHNALIDLGEDFIITQVFQEGTGTVVAENAQIASICLSEDANYNASQTVVENTSVSTFDSADGMTVTENCIEDTAVDGSSTNGVAVIDGGITFDAGTHVDQGETVTNIGICPAISTGGPTFNGCAAAGAGSNTLLFAIVNITDFTLGAGESATITYTFDVAE